MKTIASAAAFAGRAAACGAALPVLAISFVRASGEAVSLAWFAEMTVGAGSGVAALGVARARRAHELVAARRFGLRHASIGVAAARRQANGRLATAGIHRACRSRGGPTAAGIAEAWCLDMASGPAQDRERGSKQPAGGCDRGSLVVVVNHCFESCNEWSIRVGRCRRARIRRTSCGRAVWTRAQWSCGRHGLAQRGRSTAPPGGRASPAHAIALPGTRLTDIWFLGTRDYKQASRSIPRDHGPLSRYAPGEDLTPSLRLGRGDCPARAWNADSRVTPKHFACNAGATCPGLVP